MSFTSQIVRIGEGWDLPGQTREDSSQIYIIQNNGASALGAEGSSDDSKELFPDTFVDMAKKANKKIEEEEKKEKRGLFFWRKRKKNRSEK